MEREQIAEIELRRLEELDFANVDLIDVLVQNAHLSAKAI